MSESDNFFPLADPEDGLMDLQVKFEKFLWEYSLIEDDERWKHIEIQNDENPIEIGWRREYCESKGKKTLG